MHTIRQARPTLNGQALDETLRRELGTVYIGLSTGNGFVTLFLQDTADKATLAHAQAVLEAHDPTVLTAEQQRRQSEQQQLATWRKAYTSPLALTDYPTTDPTLQTLIARLAWLEAEVRALRG